MKALHVLLCFAATIAVCHASIFAGNVDFSAAEDVVWVFLGKFCYEGSRKFNSTISLQVPWEANPNIPFPFKDTTYFAIYDDQKISFPAALKADNCTNKLSAARLLVPLVNVVANPQEYMNIQVIEHYNRWWYATMIDCVNPVTIDDYAITFLNKGKSQLSYEKMGLGPMHTMFFCIYTILLILSALPRFRAFYVHPLSRIIVMVVGCFWFSKLFLLSYYFSLEHKGSGGVGLYTVGEFVDYVGMLLLFGQALLLANGWMIFSMPALQRAIIMGITGVYFLFFVILMAWGANMRFAWWYIDTLMATPIGTTLVTIQLCIWIYFIYSMFFVTLPGEQSRDRRQWLTPFFYVSAVWQFVCWFFCYMAHAVASYNQARFVWGLLALFNLAYILFLCVHCSPSKIQNLYGSISDKAAPLTGPTSNIDPAQFIDRDDQAPPL